MKKIILNLILLFFIAIPAVIAAEVTIDSSASSDKDKYRKNMLVFTSDQVGYVFYTDSSGYVAYKKTTDGGASWGTKNTISATNDSEGPIVWYDKWTPGNTGNLIHILSVEGISDDLFYIQFNTINDSVSSVVNITGSHTGTWDDNNRYYITKSIDGTLMAAIIDDSATATYATKCSSSCTDNANWGDTGGSFPFGNDAGDDIILMPIDNGDILGINWDISANSLYYSEYSSVTDTWASQTLLTSTATDDTGYKSAWGASVNPDTYTVYLLYQHDVYLSSGDVNSYIYSSGTWTAKTQFDNNNSQVSSVAFGIDSNNGDIYGVIIDQNTGSGDIVYRSYDSTMDSWGAHTYVTTNTSDDYKSISMNLINSERLYGVWFDDTDNDLVGITIADFEGRPQLISFSPVDNGYLADLTSNLEINFNKTIDIDNGNIYLKRASDDYLIETIDVNSGKVTGNGTSTLSINPYFKFPALKDFYVEIDNGAIQSTGLAEFTGFTDNGTWNFTSSKWYNHNWDYRIKITINGDNITDDLSNFPIYTDLSDLNGSTNFFEYVKSDGTDIRVTKKDGVTEIASELVYLDTSTNGGELHFVANGTLSSGIDTEFYIYYGNPDAEAYADTDTYGAENVWSNNYLGVYHLDDDPSDGADDSSSYNYTSSSNNIEVGDEISGKLGNGIDFDGVDETLGFQEISENNGTTFSFSFWYNPDASMGGTPFSEGTTGVAGCNTTEGAVGSGFTGTSIVGTEVTVGTNGISVNEHGYNFAPIVASYSTAISDWTHVYISAESTSIMKLYMNGSLVDTAQNSANTRGLKLLYFGMHAACEGDHPTDNRGDGTGDELRVATVSRDSDWIAAEYANQSNTSSFYSVTSEESFRSLGNRFYISP